MRLCYSRVTSLNLVVFAIPNNVKRRRASTVTTPKHSQREEKQEKRKRETHHTSDRSGRSRSRSSTWYILTYRNEVLCGICVL